MGDELAEMNSLTFYNGVEVLFPPGKLEPEPAILVEEGITGPAYRSVQHLNQSRTQSQNLPNLAKRLLVVLCYLCDHRWLGALDLGLELRHNSPLHYYNFLFLQFHTGQELAEQCQLFMLIGRRLDVFCDKVEKLQVQLLPALDYFQQGSDALQILLLFHLF